MNIAIVCFYWTAETRHDSLLIQWYTNRINNYVSKGYAAQLETTLSSPQLFKALKQDLKNDRKQKEEWMWQDDKLSGNKRKQPELKRGFKKKKKNQQEKGITKKTTLQNLWNLAQITV